MRKLLIPLLLMPATSHAQTGPAANFETAAGTLIDLMSVLVPIAVVLVIVGFGISILAGKEGAIRRLFTVLIPLAMVAMSIKMIGIFGDISGNSGVSEETPPTPVVPEKPGVFALAFDWIGAHILALGVGAGVVGVTALVVTRVLSKRAARNRVKQDVRDLVAAIENIESQLQYWVAVVQQSDHDTKLTRDCIATLKRIQSVLIVMLEQVHGGMPLTDNQRAAFDNAKSDAAKVARESADVPIPAGQGDARPAGPRPPAARPLPATPAAAAAGAVPVASGGLLGDMLNPLNPLSPISPFSVWPDNRHESSSRHGEDDQRRTFDTPSVPDECRCEPSSGSNDSGSGGSGSDSCGSSDSGSSDSGSSFD